MKSFASLSVLTERDPLKGIRIRTRYEFFEFLRTPLHQFITCAVCNVPIDPFAHTLSMVFALFERHRCKTIWTKFFIQPFSDL